MSPSSPNLTAAIGDEARFRALVDGITDYAIYMLDANGAVASWNEGAKRLKGFEAEEIIGQPNDLFFTIDDRIAGVPYRLLQEARAKGHCETEGWRIRKDGSKFWASVALSTITSPAGEVVGFAKVMRDATGRHSSDLALRESERRFRMLVEGVIDYAICLLDPSGIVTNWNAGAQRIKGYRAEEILGSHFSRFYTLADRAAGLPAKVLEIAAREGRYEAEGVRIRKDGSRFWAAVVIDAIRDDEGKVIGFAKVTRDITERQKGEEALRQSERQFRLLVNNVTDYALYMLDLNGIVTSWNVGAEKIKGYTAAEIIGQHFSRFYTESDRADGVPVRTLTTALTEGRFEAEGLRVRKDGSVFWAHVILDSVRDEQGELVGFAKITRDITERRESQKKLQDAQKQLAHAQKMEALGQLTGGVAHDFNNLLMIVSGQIRKIKKFVPDHEMLARSAQYIEEAVQRGSALTRQLLTFSRRQSLTPVVMEPATILKGINAMLESSVGGGVNLVSAVAPELWPIRVDRNEFELALVNIVVNARDAMPQGGTVTISGENTYFHIDQENRRVDGEYVRLTIADTGGGIPPDVLPKIFEPFFTTKSIGKGTGLGLSQAQGFVHQSGGHLVLSSEVGKGTVVRMYFPRAMAEPVPAAPPAPETVHVSGSALLVDDNGPVLDATKSMLEDLGFTVRTAGDAQEALSAVNEQNFDMVLSDIVMAGSMNGLALARAIRKDHPRMPIILATGYSDTVPEASAEFQVLRKPFHVPELSKAVASAIKGRETADNLVAFRKKAL